MIFEGVTGFHLYPSPENYDSIIFDASFLIKDGVFYWATTSDWNPAVLDKKVTWISSKKCNGVMLVIGWAARGNIAREGNNEKQFSPFSIIEFNNAIKTFMPFI